MYVDNITIATLTKLFEISIVASNLLGASSNLTINTEVFVLFSCIFFNCDFFNEKKAISDPEIIAEQNKRKNITIILIAAPGENGFNNTLTDRIISDNKCPISGYSKISAFYFTI